MTQHIITFDIETSPSVDVAVHAAIAEEIQPPGNISKQETIDAWYRDKKPQLVHDAILKTALDGARGHLAVMGAALNDEAPITFWVDSVSPHEHEVKVLTDFFHFIKEAYSPSTQRPLVFVGHNVIGFDLRFMFQRAVILGIRPPACIPFHARPWDEQVHDNMLRWNGNDRSNWISQDKLSKALGQPGKEGMDGSQVWPAIVAGNIKDVADYCADDVIQARGNYRRMTFADHFA